MLLLSRRPPTVIKELFMQVTQINSPPRSTPLVFIPLALLVATAACGSSTDKPKEAPTVTIKFPPSGFSATASKITVRGRASDPDGIASIRVNDVEAKPVQDDDLSHWIASVPLPHSTNILIVTSQDTKGNVNHEAAQTQIHLGLPRLTNPKAMAMTDKAAYVINERAIVRIDLQEPNNPTKTRVIFDDTTMSGTGDINLRNPASIAVADDIAYVIDRALDAIIEIDLNDPENKTKALFHDGTISENGNVRLADANAITVVDRVAYVTDRFWDSVVQIDLDAPTNPSKTKVVFDNGTIVDLDQPTDIAVIGSTAYVVDSALNAIVRIDLSDPDNTTDAQVAFENSMTGEDGVKLKTPTGITVTNNIAYVVDSGLGAIVRIDLAKPSTAIELFNDNTLSGDSDFDLCRPQEIRKIANIAYVVDSCTSALVQIDTQAPTNPRDTKVLFDHSTQVDNSALSLVSPTNIEIAQDIAYVVDDGLPGVLQIDLRGSGDPNTTKVLLDSDSIVFGDTFSLTSPTGIAVVDNIAYVTDSSLGILLQIDLDDPNNPNTTKIVFDHNTHPDLTLSFPAHVSVANGIAYVNDWGLNAMVQIDLNNPGLGRAIVTAA